MPIFGKYRAANMRVQKNRTGYISTHIVANRRAVAVLKFRGGLGRIVSKVKIQKQGKFGLWVRQKASSVSASLSGTIFKKSGLCYCASSQSVGPQADPQSNRSRSKVRLKGIGSFRVRQGGLSGTYNATVNGTAMPQMSIFIPVDRCTCSKWHQ